MPANPPVEVFITADAADSRIGTQDYKDGSTAPKFDLLMRGFPEDTIINLTEGIFQTTGSWAYNETLGFRTKKGWYVKGTGNYDTMVKRIAFPVWPTPINHGVFQMDMYDAGGVTIENLVINENWPNLGAAKANSSFAASLVGNNCTIRRVRPLNSHGDRVALMEGFVLAIVASHNRVDGWNNCTGGLIEECDVPDGRDVDYAIAIALLGGADGHTGSVQGIIRKNVVRNFIGTAAFGFGSNALLEDNETTGCRTSFYNDTGRCENTTIRKNRIFKNTWSAIHLAPSMGAARIDTLLIDDNDIELAGTTPHDAGIQLWSPQGRGHLANITARHNRITTLTPGPFTAISAQDVAGLLIEDNKVSEGMISRINFPDHQNNNMHVLGNRTVSGAIIPGLEDTAPPLNPIPPMEQQLDAIIANLSAQTVLIDGKVALEKSLRDQLAACELATARFQDRVNSIQATATANREKLSTGLAQPASKAK